MAEYFHSPHLCFLAHFVTDEPYRNENRNKLPWAVKAEQLEKVSSCPLLRREISTCKVGQTNLVFAVRSGSISMSVQARLQVSVCSSYISDTLLIIFIIQTHTHTHRLHFGQRIRRARPYTFPNPNAVQRRQSMQTCHCLKVD